MGRRAHLWDWRRNPRRRNLDCPVLQSCGQSGVQHPRARKELTGAGAAAAIALSCWVSEGVGLTPIKESRSLQSQVSDGLSSGENRRAAAVDPEEGALFGSGLLHNPRLWRGEEGAPVFRPGIRRREAGWVPFLLCGAAVMVLWAGHRCCQTVGYLRKERDDSKLQASPSLPSASVSSPGKARAAGI